VVKYCWYFKCGLSPKLDEKVDIKHFISEGSINGMPQSFGLKYGV
jgi:hypothetical protein